MPKMVQEKSKKKSIRKNYFSVEEVADRQLTMEEGRSLHTGTLKVPSPLLAPDPYATESGVDAKSYTISPEAGSAARQSRARPNASMM